MRIIASTHERLGPGSSAAMRARGAQQGVVLFIALIVLVAMTVAGLALIRSVDTAVLVAGNLAFRQSATQASDQGVNAAYTYLQANATGTTLQTSAPTQGYYASLATDPNWFNSNDWNTNAAQTLNGGAPDAAGNVIRYMIHRMCNGAGSYTATSCALYVPPPPGGTSGSMAVGSVTFQSSPQVYYRITTRIEGPRNTVSIVQVYVVANAS